jgi:hypothetical protein
MKRPDPETAACLERTGSAVLNVLVVDGCGIAASGLVLGRLGWGDVARWDPAAALRGAYFVLIGLTIFSFALRRILGSRAALRNPSRRAARYYWAHVLGAALGTLALPLGFAYGWLIRPVPREIIPFWVVALALGLLALPRQAELEGFDRPLPGADEVPP